MATTDAGSLYHAFSIFPPLTIVRQSGIKSVYHDTEEVVSAPCDLLTEFKAPGSIEDVLVNLALMEEQAFQLHAVLKDFETVFSGKPG